MSISCASCLNLARIPLFTWFSIRCSAEASSRLCTALCLPPVAPARLSAPALAMRSLWPVITSHLPIWAFGAPGDGKIRVCVLYIPCSLAWLYDRGYFIYGWVTIGIGILVFLFLADDPYAKIFRLTEEEKKIVAERIKDNMVVRSQEIKRSHMWEAVKEFRFWAYGVLYLLLSLQNSGMVAYSVIIIQSLGFSVRWMHRFTLKNR